MLKKLNPSLCKNHKCKNFLILSDTNFGFVVDINLKYKEINSNPYGIIGLMKVDDSESLSGLKLFVQRKNNFIDVQADLSDDPEAKKFFGIESDYQRIARMIYIANNGLILKDYVIHHEIDRLNHTGLLLLTKEQHDNLPVEKRHPKMLISESIAQTCDITIAEAEKYLSDIFTLASHFSFVREIHIDRDLIKKPLSNDESVVDLIKSMRLDQKFNKP